jgi:hypothetical protein
MAAIGISGLKRNLIVSTMLCCVAAGCSSVEYTLRSGTDGRAGRRSDTQARRRCHVRGHSSRRRHTGDSDDCRRRSDGTVRRDSRHAVTDPCTATDQPCLWPDPADARDDGHPVCRADAAPGNACYTARLCRQPAELALWPHFRRSTPPHPMMDYGFDTSGPIDPPAAPPMFGDNDDDGAPTVEKSAITKIIDKYSADLQGSGIAASPRRSSRKPLQSEGLQQARLLRPHADQVQHRQVHGLRRPAGRPLRRRNQHQICGKYLRGAWLVSDSSEDNAVRLYARGYYYDAKRKGMDDIAHGNY